MYLKKILLFEYHKIKGWVSFFVFISHCYEQWLFLLHIFNQTIPSWIESMYEMISYDSSIGTFSSD